MSRKYRQRGYMESDRSDRDRVRPERPPRKRPLTPEEKARVRGLRHATERQANEVVRCPNCGTNTQAIGAITADTTCAQCRAALHCCRACRQFDSAARWECRAKITERVADKLKANQCSHYEPRLVLDATGKRVAKTSNDPRSRFEDLFKR